MDCSPPDLSTKYDSVDKLNELLKCKKIEMHFYTENTVVDKIYFHYQGKTSDYIANLFSYNISMSRRTI